MLQYCGEICRILLYLRPQYLHINLYNIQNMLKRLLPLFSIAASLTFMGRAQNAITLTENDIISAGNVAFLVTDTAPVASMSTEAMKNGANVTWDFTKVHSHESDEINFVVPSSTTYGTYYPQSNLCAITKSTGYNAYFTTSTSGFIMTGIVGDLLEMNFDIKAFLSPGQTLMQFPATYQTTFSAPYVATAKEYYGKWETVDINGFPLSVYVDSVAAKYEISITSEIDGWGTVITPNGSYSALRQKNVETEVDSQYVYIQGMGWMLADAVTYTTDRLRWWANGVGYALAECKYNPNKNKIKGEFQYVSSTNPIVTSIVGIDFDDEILLFPNPASAQIKFSNLSADAVQLAILDVTGKEVSKLNIENNNGEWTLVTADYTNGVYFYNLVDVDGQSLRKGKFSVAH